MPERSRYAAARNRPSSLSPANSSAIQHALDLLDFDLEHGRNFPQHGRAQFARLHEGLDAPPQVVVNRRQLGFVSGQVEDGSGAPHVATLDQFKDGGVEQLR